MKLTTSWTKKICKWRHTQLKFASGHLSHAFAIKKPKKQNPEKNPKPENITEEIREKDAEKIVLTQIIFCLTQPKYLSNSEFRRVSLRNRRKNPEKTTLHIP